MVSNILTSLGGGSGIDTKALVESLVAAERAPRDTILDSKTKTLETQISGYGALRSAMTGIQDSIKLLADPDTFNARNVTFANTDLVTPTEVDAGSLTGNYSINVTALAASHSLSTGGFADIDAVVGSGTMTFSFGDWDAGHTALDTTNATKATKILTIDSSNNSLSGIRDAINNGDFGVQASIIETGGSYSLQMTADSGANNEMQISVTEGVPTGLSALAYEVGSLTMAEGTTGADAAFTVNGLAVTRESNSIDDVIDGLSFTLNGLSTDVNDNIIIGVEADSGFGEQIVRDFVEAYNLFLGQVEGLTTATELDDDAVDLTLGSLARDPSAKGMESQIRSLISSTIDGLTGNYTALATIGIQTELSGEISINESQFQSVLDNNFSALTDLMTGTSSSSDARVNITRTKAATAAGSFAVVVTTDPAKGFMTGNAISAGDATTLGLTTATGSFGAGLDTSVGSYSFKVSVDGTSSSLITLSGTYTDTDALIADMELQINGDSALSGVAAALDLSYDTASGSFTATSRSYGGASTVSFSALGTDMALLGLAGTSTSGVDVAGTIDGVDMFGSGNILLPALGSELEGLILEIAPGVTNATITLSRGFSNEVNNILDDFLANSGLIDTRESLMDKQLTAIKTDRTDLDSRMEVRYAQLQSQFLAMERIISSLNATSSQLDGLIEGLPFTAKS